MMNGIIFLCLFNIRHFSFSDCSEVKSKRTQKDAGEEKSHSKIEADDEFGLTIQREGSERACLGLHRKALGKPDMEVNDL